MRRHNSRFLACALALLMLLLLTVPLVGCGNGGTNGDGSGDGNGSAASIVLAAQFSENMTQDEKSTAREAAIHMIKLRLDAYGVGDYVVEKQGSGSILVEVKHLSDVEAITELISRTAYLEFRGVEMNGSTVATLGDYLSENRTAHFDTTVLGSRVFYLGSQVPVAILTIADDGTQAYADKDGNPLDTATLSNSAAQSWMPALGIVDGQNVLLTGAYLSSAKSESCIGQTTSVFTWGVRIE